MIVLFTRKEKPKNQGSSDQAQLDPECVFVSSAWDCTTMIKNKNERPLLNDSKSDVFTNANFCIC